LKRSNRLVLLVGVFLAIVAFVAVIVLSGNSQNGTPRASAAPTTGNVVIATADIPLSTRIGADQVTVKVLDLTAILPGAFSDPSQIIGRIVRQPVRTGAQITTETIGAVNGTVVDVQVPAGLRAIAVRVDQTSGVGTVIKSGDYVDSIIALNEQTFASVVPTASGVVTVTNPGPKGTTTKLILQGMQVLGTLLPPVAAPSPGASGAPSAGPGTALNPEQQELVILAVTAQQAEVFRYMQVVADPLVTVALILRSPDDFIDPVTRQPLTPVIDETTGIVLRQLIAQYGVLPPTVVQPVLPGPGNIPVVIPTPRPSVSPSPSPSPS
jgi:Flp pilus assembly protein CpaB